MKKLEIAPENASSNHPSEFPFVVQAFNAGMGWVDTKHGAENFAEGMVKANNLLNDDRRWVGDERRVRVVPSKKEN